MNIKFARNITASRLKSNVGLPRRIWKRKSSLPYAKLRTLTIKQTPKLFSATLGDFGESRQQSFFSETRSGIEF